MSDDLMVAVLADHRWLGTRRYFGRCSCDWISRAHFRMATCHDEHAAHLADALRVAGYIHRDEQETTA